MTEKYVEYLKNYMIVSICLTTFFLSGIIVNCVQCVLYLTLYRFSKYLYRKINWYLCATIFSQAVFFGSWWANIKMVIYTDRNYLEKYFGKEHALLVFNHTYEIDWLVAFMIADQLGTLGNGKALSKKSVQYIPVLGWTFKFAEYILLERSYDKDREILTKQVKELVDYPDPMVLALYPEGTRFTPEKHKLSQIYAKNRNLKQLTYHLQPRTKGFIDSVSAMKGKIPAVYNLEAIFDNANSAKPTLSNILLRKPFTIYFYLKRIPYKDLSSTEKEQEQFLRKMFEEKDLLHDNFEKTGDLFATGVTRLQRIEFKRRICTLLNTLCWCVVILVPITFHLINMTLNGELRGLSIGVGTIVVIFLLIKYTINRSKVRKQQ